MARRSQRTSRKKSPRKRRVRVLLTCIGRRVELLRAFRDAGKSLGVRLEIHGADASPLAPALQFVDHHHIVPTIESGKYIDALAELIQKEKIELLIPLIDWGLPGVAAAVDRFAALGCRALVSSPTVVEICRDKLLTYRKLTEAGIDTPATWPWVAAVEQKRHRFPYFLKPRSGSAGMGSYVVRSVDELRTFGARVENAIVQEFVEGSEHTLDVYVDFHGKVRCVVPRKRLEVRSGEVSKGLIVKDRAIMSVGKRVVELLGGCLGVITVQCIVASAGRIRVIEINPRFGGGAPLSIHAGADFPKWILQELLGRKPRIDSTGFRDDVAMLRYDESVFLEKASKELRITNDELQKKKARPRPITMAGRVTRNS